MKKTLSLFLAVLMLLSCFAGLSFTASAAPSNGWYADGDDWYYYENGSTAKGWRQIKGVWYYFQPVSGVMYCNDSFEIGSTLYVFNASGAMQANGWVALEDSYVDEYQDEITEIRWFYATSSGAAFRNTWQLINNKWYYFGEYGEMYTGYRELPDGNYYYFNESGALQTGLFIVDSGEGHKWLEYADENGVLAYNEWKHIDGKWYYFPNDIPLGHGDICEIDGKYYAFGDDCAMIENGWGSITYFNGYKVWVYADKSGELQKGWLKSGGKWYYINDDYEMVNSLEVINGKPYAFDYYSGEMVTGWSKTLFGGFYINWVYADKNGNLMFGWVYDGGKWYYIDPYEGMFVGRKKVDGEYYLFDSSGAWQKNPADGWKKLTTTYTYGYGDVESHTVWMYYENGNPVTGWKKIGGTWYYFNELESNFGAMVAGSGMKINGKVYLFDKSGAWVSKQGWNKIEDTYKYYGKTYTNTYWYYLQKDGTCLTGWQKIGGKEFCFSTSGNMYGTGGGSSKVNEENLFYYFNDDGSVSRKEGWRSRVETEEYMGETYNETEWYYVFADGTVAANEFWNVNGVWYYFGYSGTMYSHTMITINGVECTFASSGALVDPSYPPTS